MMLSFPVRIDARGNKNFSWEPAAETGVASAPGIAQADEQTATVHTDGLDLRAEADRLQIIGKGGVALGAIRPFGPAFSEARTPTLNLIENGPFFAWLRWRQDGSDYSRQWDLEVNKRGRIKLVHRILRHLPGNGWTPDFGFELSTTDAESLRLPERPVRFRALPVAAPLREHPQLFAAFKRLAQRL